MVVAVVACVCVKRVFVRTERKLVSVNTFEL